MFINLIVVIITHKYMDHHTVYLTTISIFQIDILLKKNCFPVTPGALTSDLFLL